MKKRILMAVAALFVLGLAIAAFAYKTANHSPNHAKMECCCKDGVCPMKANGAATGETASCCDNPDCCCKGGSCPMKNKAETSQAIDTKNVTIVSGDEKCESDCCKHKKQG